MDELCSTEIKKRLLILLSEFSSFCEKNNLTYSLYAGTALGAIRHKGFIPWDDDIDVCMPRADYQRFIEIYKNSDKFKLLSPKLLKYYYPFSKLVDNKTYSYCDDTNDKFGIFIDIFPLDLVDVQQAEKLKKYLFSFSCADLAFRIPNINSIYSKCKKTHPKSAFIHVLFFYLRKVIMRRIRLRINKLRAMLFYRNDKLECARFGDTNFCNLYFANHIYSLHIFDNLIKVDFENKKFYIFENYDEYLTYCYGDYMIPPKNPVNYHLYHFLINYCFNIFRGLKILVFRKLLYGCF